MTHLGTLASDVNFQVYLLDGVHRWNEDRHKDATAAQTTQSHLSYNGALRDSVNKLSSRVLGRKMCRDFTAPGKYTGELIGLEYLYSQSTGASVEYNEAVHSIEEDAQPDEEHTGDDNEGFEDLLPFEDLTIPPLRSTVPSRPLLPYPTDEEYRQMMDDQVGTNSIRPPSHSQSGQSQEPTTVTMQRQQPSTASSGQEQSEHHTKETPVPTTGVQYEPQVEMSPATANPGATSCDDSNIGPDNIPGYKHVTDLASFLCSLHEQTDSLSTAQANEVIRLWDALSDYDKSRTKFPQRFSSSGSGRFRSPKKLVALGVTSIERAVLGPNPTRANWPSCYRYVEATVEQLVKVYPCDKRTKGKHPVSRWIRIKDAYGRVQNLILNNIRVMENTEIQLPSLNKTTITQWYNKKGKQRDEKILLQGIQLPQPPMTGSGALAPKVKPDTLPTGHSQTFEFNYPPDTAGMAKLKVKKQQLPATLQSDLRPILPRPTLTDTVSDLRFPFVAVPLQQTATPISQVTVHKKHKDQSDAEVVRRKYTKTATAVKCPKCGQDRTPPEHQQYMGYRFCSRTSTITFQQWRQDLKLKGAARKKKF